MQVITVTGSDASGNLQPFHIINPTNVVVNVGEIKVEGNLKDGQGKPIPITKSKTFVHVGGQPILCEETPDEIKAQIEAL